MYEYMKGLYKKGCGTVMREDIKASEAWEGARTVRAVALSKEFQFRVEKGGEGTGGDEVNVEAEGAKRNGLVTGV